MEDIPIEYGDDCLLAFEAGKTPKYLYARFVNLVKCPDVPPDVHVQPPNDRAFKLTQAPGAPCLWEYDVDPWYIWMEFIEFPAGTRLHILHRPSGDNHFTNLVDGYIEEGYVFTNEYLVCGLQVGSIDGIAVVTWTPQATDLLAAINLAKGYDLFMELFPREDGKLVYKFCKLKDATNIKILYDPRNYEVTGILVPDVTGTYDPRISYNDKPLYEITTTQWFIWWDGIDTWNISTVPGIQGTNFWTRTDPDIEGIYDPTPPATGDATVSLIV
ncbi:unnamed protein product [marine sediment metagenome]|uniref:Uncharacterized protein n=1 Tax=marine sediment metagenome TaxID=412755 RepID=X1FXB3_9ZZZZ